VSIKSSNLHTFPKHRVYLFPVVNHRRGYAEGSVYKYPVDTPMLRIHYIQCWHSSSTCWYKSFLGQVRVLIAAGLADIISTQW